MDEIARIRDQLLRAYRGEAWHGPSLREALAGVSAEMAAARPLEGAHGIWELVLHVAGWMEVVERRLAGEEAPEPARGDWPAVERVDEAAWGEALETLDRAHRELLEALSRVDARRLDEPVLPESGTSVYCTLHGVIQHNLYHAGQIALLKRGLAG